MTRYEIYQACHEPDETYSSWLSARLSEWASLSGRADELTRERRSGWRFPVLVSHAHHAAFESYLHDWLATKNAEGPTMKFSLINITAKSGPLVSGSWIQNHIGSLASAHEAARATEAANSNRIEVAVVAELSSTTPALSYWRDLTRLDVDP